MTDRKEARIGPASSFANDAVFSSKAVPATSWLVPPLLVPIFLFALFLAHVAHQWGVMMTPWVGEAGDALKRLVQGAIAGALIAIFIGFTWAGWTLGG
jgi:hypothetical protein